MLRLRRTALAVLVPALLATAAPAAAAPAAGASQAAASQATASQATASQAAGSTAVASPAVRQAAGPAVTRWLSDLAPGSARNGWGPAETDRSNGEIGAADGRPLGAGGRTFAKGLGVHADSELTWTVPAGCTRFSATVGVDDEVGSAGSVVFQVFTQRGRVWDSGVRRGTSPNRALSVPVQAGSVLRLVVADAGDGNGHDHAAWGAARLTCRARSAPSVGAETSPAVRWRGTVAAPAAPTGVLGTWRALFTDEFTGTSINPTTWTDHEPWEARGTNEHHAWRPVPATTDQLQVSDGKVSLKARRGTGLPNGAAFTTAHINTRGKFSIPGGVTSYTEARMKAPSGNGLLPGFWLLGNGTSADGGGWPVTGEIDILEFANNNKGEKGKPYTSLWFPKDVYTAPPGTWMNATHVSHKDSYITRTDLYDTWHTWGLYRSPSKMEIYIDGVKLATWLPNTSYNGNIPLPPMLFTNPQHIRLSLMVGGTWAGAGYTTDQYQNGDLDVDYIKVWQHS